MGATKTNPAAAHVARIRQILGPAVKLYAPATPSMPACECLKSAPCPPCAAYNVAGNALASAAAALRGIGGAA